MRKSHWGVTLVTGGGSGIGYELAKQLAERGATVVICGRSMDRLDAALKATPKLSAIRCDITNAAERQALHREVIGRYGRLDTLVNNAGYGERYSIARAKNLEERVTAEWRTNFLAPVLLNQLFLPALLESKGRIIHVNSGLAYIPLSIEPSYCASKSALRSMTQSLRFQLSGSGIRVSEVYFPAVHTAFHGGHSPPHAIESTKAVAAALKGLNAGKNEVYVGLAGVLRVLSRIAPTFALNKLNGLIPADVESLLDNETRH